MSLQTRNDVNTGKSILLFPAAHFNSIAVFLFDFTILNYALKLFTFTTSMYPIHTSLQTVGSVIMTSSTQTWSSYKEPIITLPFRYIRTTQYT